jgi:hypothetical protein
MRARVDSRSQFANARVKKSICKKGQAGVFRHEGHMRGANCESRPVRIHYSALRPSEKATAPSSLRARE